MKITHQKPFPWKCGECGQMAVMPTVVPYSLDMEHDGRTYQVNVPDLAAPRCEHCGEVVLDDAASRRLGEVFREQLGLLSPEQIRQNRERLGKTQRDLAASLGIAEATLSRWETGGQIQQRALDRLLRIFFEFPSVRRAVADPVQLRSMGLVSQPSHGAT